MSVESLVLEPIGILKNNLNIKFKAEHQPAESVISNNEINSTTIVQLYDKEGFKDALKDLEGFTRIWLIFWFDRNKNWRPLVLPPRGEPKRRGVFATRSPHRPNPIGMTPVTLLKIDYDTLTIEIDKCDILDNTPILDIKPYIPAYDSFPDSKAGWVDSVDSYEKSIVPYKVCISELAKTQLAFLKDEYQIDFIEKAISILEKDPRPHRTRRIYRYKDKYMMGCGPWRILFSVIISDRIVTIEKLRPGFPESTLKKENVEEADMKSLDFNAQLAFMIKYSNIS